MLTLVQNLAASAVTLPAPYNAIIPPGAAIILGERASNVRAALNTTLLARVLNIREVPDSQLGDVWTSTVPTVGMASAATLSVQTTGNDAARNVVGGDYSETPWLTLAGALNSAPRALTYDMLVTLGASTFVGAAVSGFYSGAFGAGLYIHGTPSAFAPTTGVASGTAGAGTASTSLVKPTAAANWTASNLVGKLLRVLSGGGSSGNPLAPVVRPIKANTTTSLTVDAVPGMDASSVFDIVLPGTTLTAINATNKSCLDVNCCQAPVTIRYVKFSGAGLDYLVKAQDCGAKVTLEGCVFDLTATVIELLAQRNSGFELKNCVFNAGAGASIGAISGSLLVTNVWMSAAGTLTLSDSPAPVTIRGLDSSDAVSRVLGAFRIPSMTAEVRANNGGATPVYLEDTNCTAAGTNLMSGSGNTGYGIEIARSGRVTLTGSTLTGSLGDVLMFGYHATWANLSNPGLGIVTEHAGSAVGNAAYTKAIVLGNRDFIGDTDFDGRVLLRGYLNQAWPLAAQTAVGTNAATALQMDAIPALGGVEIGTAASGTGVRLPSNAAVAGVVIGVVNRGANTITVYAPAGGTIDGAASVTIATQRAKTFVSLAGGLAFWTLSAT